MQAYRIVTGPNATILAAGAFLATLEIGEIRDESVPLPVTIWGEDAGVRTG